MSKKRKVEAASLESDLPQEDVDVVISEPGIPEIDKPKYSALSKEAKEALKTKAREMAVKKVKEKLEDEYLKEELAKAEVEENSKVGIKDEELVRHTVNLSSAADRIIINGTHYIHGHTYEVKASLAACMRDIEYRGHVQEDIRRGNDRNEYGFKERNGIRSGAGVVIA